MILLFLAWELGVFLKQAKREGRASALRIDKVYENPSSVKLTLEERLVGEWVSLLEEKILECLDKTISTLCSSAGARALDEIAREVYSPSRYRQSSLVIAER